MREPLIIANVALPIYLDDYFIAPDLWDALKFYPNFMAYSGKDWSIQAYLSAIMKEIDRRQPNGYNCDKAVSELIDYMGWRNLGAILINAPKPAQNAPG